MDPFKEKKTKRINIRITPSDHDWLFEFAKENELTVSKLFERFLAVLKQDSEHREDAHGEAEVS